MSIVFVNPRLIAMRILMLIGLTIIATCCTRPVPAPDSTDRVAPVYSPERFRADLEQLVAWRDYDGAVQLVQAANVDRQAEYDAVGYLAIDANGPVLPGVSSQTEFDIDRDWVFPGSSDAAESRAWQQVAIEFATRYNQQRESERAEPDTSLATEKEHSINLAFVLLSEAKLPETEAVIEAYREFALPDEILRESVEESGINASDEGLSLELGTGERSIVVLLRATVPGGEAERAARYSVASFGRGWKLPRHTAQLVVTFESTTSSPALERVSRFTSLLAALVKASPAVGVYWGNAGATHGSEFFISIASEQGVSPRMLLWSGVSVARKEDGRLSLLSVGMEQFELPNLLILAGEESASDALPFMYDLLTYVAQLGEPLPEGDTVGWTDEQRLPVRYVESPRDPEKRVWCVELP